jgi:hypothetical protein
MFQKRFFILAAILGLSVGVLPLKTLAASPQATSTIKASSLDDLMDEDQPFKPYWDNEIQFSSANQQAGQSTNSLSYTGTQHYDEVGDFLSGTVETSRQKIEGVFSSTGTLTVEGGLGIGSFSPSLSLGFEGGENALKQFNGNLILDFQITDPFTLSLSLGGNAGSHEGDISAFYPSLQGNVRIDTASTNSSLSLIFTLLDWWTLSVTPGFQYDNTYQLQSINHPALKVPVNQADQIATLTFGLDFALFKDFVLDLSPQLGKEYLPAGSVYSPLKGGLVQNSSPTTNNFVGGTVSVSYSFE